MGCVKSFFLRQLNRFIVRPRVCRTLLTQIPMAADSLADSLAEADANFLFLNLTVVRTFLIQLQKRDTSVRAI